MMTSLRRAVLSATLAFVSVFSCLAQVDSSRFVLMDSLLEEYYDALKYYSWEQKASECDALIEDVSDSLLRQHAALSLYCRYMSSKVMGDEGVAVHLFDKWFATRRIRMRSDIDFVNASIYAEFNRASLIGLDAPELSMTTSEGNRIDFPLLDRVSIIYFYDTDCAKCKIETTLLTYALDDVRKPVDVYAVYVGDNAEAWAGYRSEKLVFKSGNVTLHNVWDPEMQSDFQRKYGVLQTPVMMLVDHKGVIVGRKLDSAALLQLLPMVFMDKELYDRCPAGQPVPDMVMEGELISTGNLLWRYRAPKARKGTFSLRKLRGKPTYVFFHSKFCQNCQEEYAAAMEFLQGAPKGTKIFSIIIDDWLKDNPTAEQQAALDTFDISTIPYIIKLDRKGVVLERYCTFLGGEK